MNTYLMTYGTLRSGKRNNYLLNDATFVGKVKTKPKYRLFDCGHYPCMIESTDGYSVEGELYLVNEHTLAVLDQLEGVPVLYKRTTIEIEDCPHSVQGYIYQRDVSRFKECGKAWHG